MPPFDHDAFNDVADMIYNAGGFNLDQIKDPKARKLIRETVNAINRGVDAHLPTDVPDTLRCALEENGFIFSGFKTFHAMRELGLSMLTTDGNIKSYNEFKKDVQQIDAHYNTNYLYAEYKHAIGACQMAAKWHEQAKDGDRYDLQYRTAQDPNVREDHRLLHGTTLPLSDPFWDKYYPPNGWGCRCTVVQVRKGKYPLSDPKLAMLRGDNATDTSKLKIFRYNPGKSMTLFPPKHPYYKAPAEAKAVCNELGKQYAEHRKLYQQLKDDTQYTDVHFDSIGGGLKASHVGHNFDKKGGLYEKHVQEAGYKAGHAVIFGDESKHAYHKRFTEGTWDGLDFEVAGKESVTENSILRGLKHCAEKRTTKIAVLDFPKGGFDSEVLRKAIKRYKGLEKLNDGQYVKFVEIICVQGSEIVLRTTL